jgi:hypothetical protein
MRLVSPRTGFIFISGTISNVAKPSILDHGTEFVRHVVPAVMKPIRTLWNELIGLIFVVLAVAFGSQMLRAAMRFDGEARAFFEICMSAFLFLLMAFFGFSSFRRARKISRS